jgi:nitrogen fixation/metabolism regulation signal transduction histidine kinase
MAKQVAHEIKNPLTPMKLTIQQLIASYKEGEKNFEKLFEKVSSSLLSQIDSLSQIASEFSRFARMPNPSLTHVDLLPLINEVKYLFSEEHIKIEVETEIDTAIIEADHSHLRRTFINIIRNSIQAGSNLIHFRLIENEFYILTIADNGKGIEESNIDKIFKKDFSTKDTGMGIGLKLAKRFIDSIGGKIFLKETSDKGTSFEIHFPKTPMEKND